MDDGGHSHDDGTGSAMPAVPSDDPGAVDVSAQASGTAPARLSAPDSQPDRAAEPMDIANDDTACTPPTSPPPAYPDDDASPLTACATLTDQLERMSLCEGGDRAMDAAAARPVLPLWQTTALRTAPPWLTALLGKLPRIQSLTVFGGWRGPSCPVHPAEPAPPSPLPSPPPPANAKDVARHCPAAECEWKCTDVDPAARKRLLADHLMVKHADNQVSETSIHAHGLHQCVYCRKVLNVDPTLRHQSLDCNGNRAPKLTQAQWQRRSEEELTEKWRGTRARQLKKIADAARATLQTRHDGEARVVAAPARMPLGVMSGSQPTVRSSTPPARPGGAIAADVLPANANRQSLLTFFPRQGDGRNATASEAGARGRPDLTTVVSMVQMTPGRPPGAWRSPPALPESAVGGALVLPPTTLDDTASSHLVRRIASTVAATSGVRHVNVTPSGVTVGVACAGSVRPATPGGNMGHRAAQADETMNDVCAGGTSAGMGIADYIWR